MNKEQLLISLATLALLLALNHFADASAACVHCPGGLPWYGWMAGFGLLFGIGFVFARRRGARAHALHSAGAAHKDTGDIGEKLTAREPRICPLHRPTPPHPRHRR